jgi:hypothetical protein
MSAVVHDALNARELKAERAGFPSRRSIGNLFPEESLLKMAILSKPFHMGLAVWPQ